jgi:hypothetical protein
MMPFLRDRSTTNSLTVTSTHDEAGEEEYSQADRGDEQTDTHDGSRRRERGTTRPRMKRSDIVLLTPDAIEEPEPSNDSGMRGFKASPYTPCLVSSIHVHLLSSQWYRERRAHFKRAQSFLPPSPFSLRCPSSLVLLIRRLHQSPLLSALSLSCMASSHSREEWKEEEEDPSVAWARSQSDTGEGGGEYSWATRLTPSICCTLSFLSAAGPRLPHHSNLPISAHSRAGFYPEHDIPEVQRRRTGTYEENRDQPQMQTQRDTVPLHMQLAEGAQRERRISRTKGVQPYAKAPIDSERLDAQYAHIERFNLTRLFPLLRFKKPHEHLPGVYRIEKPKPTRTARSQRKITSGNYSPGRGHSALMEQGFNPESPSANYTRMRVERADAAGENQMITSLSPRTHHRAVQLFHASPTSPIPYHPSHSGRPGTSPLLSSHPHRHPWRPSNPSEAREAFAAKTKGPFLGATGPYQAPSDLQFRPNGGGSTRFKTVSSKQAAESTKVDYFLSSPDELVKRLERMWVQQQSSENRAKFLEDLRKLQASDRQKIHARGIKEGRIQIAEALPPRPLALDNVRDMNRIRYLGQ